VIWIASCINTFFATELVDMFPQTNGDILLHFILVWIGSRKLTSIRTYRAMLSAFVCSPETSRKSAEKTIKWAFIGSRCSEQPSGKF